jgi:hypothetical protein
MGSVWPADIIDACVQSVGFGGGDQSLAIVRMDGAFIAQKKACSDPRARRTERHDGREPATIGDATRRNNGRWGDRINDCRNKRQCGDCAANMAASLPSLSDDYVSALVDGLFGFFG